VNDGDEALAFICAMPMEVKPLVRRLALRRTELGASPAYEGTLDGRRVVAIVTGMGTRLARDGTERLLDAVGVARVVVVGITGAVEDETPIGTLILPEVVVDAATRTEHRPAPLGEGTPHGTMWTGDDLTTDHDVVTGLRDAGVVCLDMETAAIADVAERRDIPWSVFRAISDRATDGTVTEEVFHLSNQDGTPNGGAVLRFFLRHPGRLPAMMRMAKGAKLATQHAADAAIRACEHA
jgi:adenosylhomocysteine nucleosidase